MILTFTSAECPESSSVSLMAQRWRIEKNEGQNTLCSLSLGLKVGDRWEILQWTFPATCHQLNGGQYQGDTVLSGFMETLAPLRERLYQQPKAHNNYEIQVSLVRKPWWSYTINLINKTQNVYSFYDFCEL